MKPIIRCAVLGLILLLTACNRATPLPQETLDPAAVATAVAATLAAAPTVPVPDAVMTPTTVMLPSPESTIAATPAPANEHVLVALVDTARNLSVWDGESNREVVSSGDVTGAVISPDGAWIAYTRSADYLHTSLWVIAPDGSGMRELIRESDFDALPRVEYAVTTGLGQLEWVPGTHTLAYNTSPRFEGPGYLLNDDLRLVNADNGERVTLLESGLGGRFFYSPDGRQIAVVQHRAVHLVNADGTNYRANVMSYHDINTASEYLYYAAPVWMGDSRALRAAIPPSEPWTAAPEATTLWHIPTDGSAAQQVGEIDSLFFNEALHAPDGEHLAFLSQADSAGSLSALYVADYDGSAATLYWTGQIHTIAWSPDAYHFTFMDGAGPSTYIASLDDQPVLLTDVMDAYGVTWVDAERFLFLRKIIGGWELRLGQLGQSSRLVAEVEDTESGYTPWFVGVGY